MPLSMVSFLMRKTLISCKKIIFWKRQLRQYNIKGQLITISDKLKITLSSFNSKLHIRMNFPLSFLKFEKYSQTFLKLISNISKLHMLWKKTIRWITHILFLQAPSQLKLLFCGKLNKSGRFLRCDATRRNGWITAWSWPSGQVANNSRPKDVVCMDSWR